MNIKDTSKNPTRHVERSETGCLKWGFLARTSHRNDIVFRFLEVSLRLSTLFYLFCREDTHRNRKSKIVIRKLYTHEIAI